MLLCQTVPWHQEINWRLGPLPDISKRHEAVWGHLEVGELEIPPSLLQHRREDVVGCRECQEALGLGANGAVKACLTLCRGTNHVRSVHPYTHCLVAGSHAGSSGLRYVLEVVYRSKLTFSNACEVILHFEVRAPATSSPQFSRNGTSFIQFTETRPAEKASMPTLQSPAGLGPFTIALRAAFDQRLMPTSQNPTESVSEPPHLYRSSFV